MHILLSRCQWMVMHLFVLFPIRANKFSFYKNLWLSFKWKMTLLQSPTIIFCLGSACEICINDTWSCIRSHDKMTDWWILYKILVNEWYINDRNNETNKKTKHCTAYGSRNGWMSIFSCWDFSIVNIHHLTDMTLFFPCILWFSTVKTRSCWSSNNAFTSSHWTLNTPTESHSLDLYM